MSEQPAKQDVTKSYYEKYATGYAERTVRMSLDGLWNTLTRRLRPGADVLDLGCGAGRDLKELARRGFTVLGVDYSAPLAALAREYSGQEVLVADVREIEFPEG